MAKMLLHMESAAAPYREERRRLALLQRADIHASCKLGPGSRIINEQGERGSVAENCAVLGDLCVFPRSGRVAIGRNTFIGEHSRIWSAQSITIGSYVLISHNVNVHDTRGHPISYRERRIEIDEILPRLIASDHTFDLAAQPIVVEDDVWVGFNAIIRGGVRIGRGAVVGAGTIVTDDVPSFAVVAGNPMRVLRTLE